MTTATITIKQHDTKIRFQDTPKKDGVALTTAELASIDVLSFLMGNSSWSIKRTATIEGGDFIYDPIAEDVANNGRFRQEWEAHFIDGRVLTFPNNGYNIVDILADLG